MPFSRNLLYRSRVRRLLGLRGYNIDSNHYRKARQHRPGAQISNAYISRPLLLKQ